MKNKLFIAGLTPEMTDEKLLALFSTIGTVDSAKAIIDRYSNQCKGFGFVEMNSEALATEAIAKLHDTEVDGRKLVVKHSEPQIRS